MANPDQLVQWPLSERSLSRHWSGCASQRGFEAWLGRGPLCRLALTPPPVVPTEPPIQGSYRRGAVATAPTSARAPFPALETSSSTYSSPFPLYLPPSPPTLIFSSWGGRGAQARRFARSRGAHRAPRDVPLCIGSAFLAHPAARAVPAGGPSLFLFPAVPSVTRLGKPAGPPDPSAALEQRRMLPRRRLAGVVRRVGGVSFRWSPAAVPPASDRLCQYEGQECARVRVAGRSSATPAPGRQTSRPRCHPDIAGGGCGGGRAHRLG